MDVNSALLGAWILILIVANAGIVFASEEYGVGAAKALIILATVITALEIGKVIAT